MSLYSAIDRSGAQGFELRRDQREDVFLSTIISLNENANWTGDLVNISRSGFLLRNTAEFGREERVKIALPTLGDEPAIVRWALAGCVGCEFIYPIADLDFPRLVVAIRNASKDWLNASAN